MVFKVLNSMGNKIEEFKPMKKDLVTYYTCGPTVYNYAHIGNFRAYTWEDLLKRYLIFLGYKVNHVMNLTDVDDKTIKGSIKENIPLLEYTEKYKIAFFEDLKTLNIIPANTYPAATEYIGQMVNLVEILMKKGIAYRGEDGSIYYSIRKFPNYGKLANININQLKEGARVKQDEYEKEGIGDFALWKNWDENDGTVFWETSLGKGRPGWHIECSAMSMTLLGETIDLHTGGIDNRFPHHENEIAQSEGVTGKKFVNYWMHCAHLQVNGEKMSKSLGNFYTLRELLENKLNPMAIRYTLINNQYNQPMNFTFNSVNDSQKTLDGLNRFIERLRNINLEDNTSIENLVNQAIDGFKEGMDDNLNMPLAMSHIFNFVKEINKLIDENAIGKTGAKEALEFLKKINEVLGVLDFREKFFELTSEQEKLLEDRKEARKNKDFKKSDEIRDLLKSQGIEIIDNKDGTTIAKAINK
ncbi:MAG: cysteine--tRNA ligase [Candidatus ainarchaeum sp.]|nr:cysteine--tRNA ligase [Candidatus ainarchaeum sp.]